MDTSRASRISAWVLVAYILAGETLFGATALRFGSPETMPRIEIRGLFFAIAIALGATTLALLPASRRPGAGWSLIVLAFPAWLALQLVPLPVSLVARINPERARLLHETWPGPLVGCEGESLVPATPPAWTSLTVDSSVSLVFLAQVVATLLAFLVGRGAFAHGRAERRRFYTVLAAFTGVEAAYGIVQWTAIVPRVLWLEKIYVVEAASGTLINRNHFAILLYLGLGCTLTLLADRLAKHRERLDSREIGIRATLTLLAAVQVAAVLVSQSRTGLAATAVLAATGVPLLLRGGNLVRALALTLISLVALPTIIVVWPELIDRISLLEAEWGATTGRAAVLRHGMDIVLAYPVFGTGGGTFDWVFAGYRGPAIQGRYRYAHDDYLQLLIEAGLIGVVLALLPVAKYGWEIARSISRGGRPARPLARPWPLWLALALFALHEFVDFGMQIPAHALLFAVLAGSASATAARAIGSRWRYVLPLAGITLIPFASLHSIQQWPSTLGVLPWPSITEMHYQRARLAINEWRNEPERAELACTALTHMARAVEERPLWARAVSEVSRVSAVVALARPETMSAELHRELVDQAEVMAERTRQIDPWNSSLRLRLLQIELSLGSLDMAARDVGVVLELSDNQADRVVDTLRRAGLPAELVARLVGESPAAMRLVLSGLLESEDWEAAARLVPIDIEADAQSCLIAPHLAEVLRRVHDVSPAPLLRACLGQLAMSEDHILLDRIRVSLTVEEMRQGRFDAAAAIVADTHNRRVGRALEYALARRTGQWDRFVVLSYEILDDPDQPLDQWREAQVRTDLADAYLELGKPALALKQYELALGLDPYSTKAEERIRGLKRGRRGR